VKWDLALATQLSMIIGEDGTGQSSRGLVSQLPNCTADSNGFLGDSLLKAFVKASAMKKKHRKLEILSTASYPAAIIIAWKAIIIAWDEDHGNRDPYELLESGMFCCAIPA
jgi:hypothetical protein